MCLNSLPAGISVCWELRKSDLLPPDGGDGEPAEGGQGPDQAPRDEAGDGGQRGHDTVRTIRQTVDI